MEKPELAIKPRNFADCAKDYDRLTTSMPIKHVCKMSGDVNALVGQMDACDLKGLLIGADLVSQLVNELQRLSPLIVIALATELHIVPHLIQATMDRIRTENLMPVASGEAADESWVLEDIRVGLVDVKPAHEYERE